MLHWVLKMSSAQGQIKNTIFTSRRSYIRTCLTGVITSGKSYVQSEILIMAFCISSLSPRSSCSGILNCCFFGFLVILLHFLILKMGLLSGEAIQSLSTKISGMKHSFNISLHIHKTERKTAQMRSWVWI